MVGVNVDTPLSDTKFRWSETALSALSHLSIGHVLTTCVG